VTFAFGWILRTDGRREVVLCISYSQLELGVGPRSRTFGAGRRLVLRNFRLAGRLHYPHFYHGRKIMRNLKIVANYTLLNADEPSEKWDLRLRNLECGDTRSVHIPPFLNLNSQSVAGRYQQTPSRRTTPRAAVVTSNWLLSPTQRTLPYPLVA
jgi:hypothetical protein